MSSFFQCLGKTLNLPFKSAVLPVSLMLISAVISTPIMAVNGENNIDTTHIQTTPNRPAGHSKDWKNGSLEVLAKDSKLFNSGIF